LLKSTYFSAVKVLAAAMANYPSAVRAGGAYVIDGDTSSVDGERIRLRSEVGPIDAPELRSAKCPLELFRAEAARDRLKALMAPNDFSIDRRGADRYGRIVAVIYSQGEDVGARLMREGHAKPWPTLGRVDRPTWCGD
jgi:micrococcal nuclease